MQVLRNQFSEEGIIGMINEYTHWTEVIESLEGIPDTSSETMMKHLIRNVQLSTEFFREHIHIFKSEDTRLDIMEYQKLSLEFLRELIRDGWIDIDELAEYTHFTEEIFTILDEEYDFSEEDVFEDLLVFHWKKISRKFIEERNTQGKINWYSFSSDYSQNFEDITEFEEFLREFHDIYDWEQFCYIDGVYRFSEKFVIEFSDHIDINELTCHMPFSESFYERFADRVDWEEIGCLQEFSPEFMKKWEHRMFPDGKPDDLVDNDDDNYNGNRAFAADQEELFDRAGDYSYECDEYDDNSFIPPGNYAHGMWD